MRKKFASAFENADTVLLCPIYKAGENILLGFSYEKFAKEIMNKSKVKLVFVNDQYQLAKFTKQNIYGQKVVIGMGAGSISNWMRNLPNFI